ncbi:MAG TPA: mechanosensitive ion channel family protein [Thermomicrobiales bacterium]|nr:mechanosensitive ion channel family protein [Thermomicrobiales bacterium]
MEITYDSLGDLAVGIGGTILLIAAWLIGGWWLSRLAATWVRRTLSRRSMDWNGSVLVSRLVSISIKAVAVLVVLNILGVSGTGLLAVVSAFTVAIGLSLQDVMKNFFAGIYLLLERPFRAGDRIVVKDVVGEVEGIDIRTTLIKNLNNELVLVPNATIFTEILRNETYFGVRRLDFTIHSENRTLAEIEGALREVLAAIDPVKQPIPAPHIVSSDPSKIVVKSTIVIDNSDEAHNRVTQAVIDALSGDTIEVVLT